MEKAVALMILSVLRDQTKSYCLKKLLDNLKGTIIMTRNKCHVLSLKFGGYTQFIVFSGEIAIK